jgi:hypothetical protein
MLSLGAYRPCPALSFQKPAPAQACSGRSGPTARRGSQENARPLERTDGHADQWELGRLPGGVAPPQASRPVRGFLLQHLPSCSSRLTVLRLCARPCRRNPEGGRRASHNRSSSEILSFPEKPRLSVFPRPPAPHSGVDAGVVGQGSACAREDALRRRGRGCLRVPVCESQEDARGSCDVGPSWTIRGGKEGGRKT